MEDLRPGCQVCEEWRWGCEAARAMHLQHALLSINNLLYIYVYTYLYLYVLVYAYRFTYIYICICHSTAKAQGVVCFLRPFSDATDALAQALAHLLTQDTRAVSHSM